MEHPPVGRSDSGPSRTAGRPDGGAPLHQFDLRGLDVPSGGASILTAPVGVAPLQLGGQTYTVDPPAPEMRLDVVRAANGWHFRLRGQADIVGPCWRCLEAARLPVTVDATEVALAGSDDPELSCLYLTDDTLDVAAWSRDAVAEAMPASVVCAPDCAGLCPTCGANLNLGDCGCITPEVDARWAALADVAERLGVVDAGIPDSDDPEGLREPPAER